LYTDDRRISNSIVKSALTVWTASTTDPIGPTPGRAHNNRSQRYQRSSRRRYSRRLYGRFGPRGKTFTLFGRAIPSELRGSAANTSRARNACLFVCLPTSKRVRPTSEVNAALYRCRDVASSSGRLYRPRSVLGHAPERRTYIK